MFLLLPRGQFCIQCRQSVGDQAGTADQMCAPCEQMRSMEMEPSGPLAEGGKVGVNEKTTPQGVNSATGVTEKSDQMLPARSHEEKKANPGEQQKTGHQVKTDKAEPKETLSSSTPQKETDPKKLFDLQGLISLCGPLKSGNTVDEIDFLTTRKTFLKENYPDLANGVFMHPPFIRTDQEEQDDDMLVCKALQEEFSEDVAFIFRTSESILAQHQN